MTVSWNGNVVLRQRLLFLITAPSQIHFGWDPTWGNRATFPRGIIVFQQDLSLPSQTPHCPSRASPSRQFPINRDSVCVPGVPPNVNVNGVVSLAGMFGTTTLN
jgi:hypothetical protein